MACTEQDFKIAVVLLEKAGDVRIKIWLVAMQRLQQAHKRLKSDLRHHATSPPCHHKTVGTGKDESLEDGGTDEAENADTHQNCENSYRNHYLSEYRIAEL